MAWRGWRESHREELRRLLRKISALEAERDELTVKLAEATMTAAELRADLALQRTDTLLTFGRRSGKKAALERAAARCPHTTDSERGERFRCVLRQGHQSEHCYGKLIGE